MSQATAPTKHYRYAPSSSKRWLACPGSARLDEPVDPIETPAEWQNAADWGHVAHETAAFSLQTGLPIFGDDWVAQIVTPYVEFVNKLPGQKSHELQYQSQIVREHGGTVDTLVIDGTHGHIVDLKTGKNKVPAKDSTQLLCYAGLVREVHPGLETLTCTIIQPQVYKKPNTVKYTADQVDEFRGRLIVASLSDAIIPGEQCRFCPFRRECEPGRNYNESIGWTR